MDVRVKSVTVDEHRLTVELMDGRSIAVPLAWYPRLFDATPEQRRNWEIAGTGNRRLGVMKRSTAAERQTRAPAESIDVAAAELRVTGPVPPAVVARVMAELEDEWLRTGRVGDKRRPDR